MGIRLYWWLFVLASGSRRFIDVARVGFFLATLASSHSLSLLPRRPIYSQISHPSACSSPCRIQHHPLLLAERKRFKPPTESAVSVFLSYSTISLFWYLGGMALALTTGPIARLGAWANRQARCGVGLYVCRLAGHDTMARRSGGRAHAGGAPLTEHRADAAKPQ